MRYLMVIFLLFCYACVTSGKGNVKFNSRNFYNTLTWDPASPKVPGQIVRYSVSYGVTDDEKFHDIVKCQNITVLSCDLTEETKPDHDTYYRAQVFADGRPHGKTRRFKPIAETVLGAPTLSFNITRAWNWSSFRLNVTLPLGPNNESIKDIFIRNHQGPSEEKAMYSLIITKPPSAAQTFENSLGHFEVFLKNQPECCGYVFYTPEHEKGRPLSENATFCIKLQDGPPLVTKMVLPWLLLSVVAVAALVLMAVCCVNHYIKKVKDKLPSSLVSKLPPSQLVLHPEKDQHISKAEIFVKREVTEYAKIQMKPSVQSVCDGVYGHKNTIFVEDSSLGTEGLHSPGLKYQDDSAQSSEIYGAVTVQDFHHHQLQQTDRNNTSLMCSGDGFDESRQLLSTPKTIPLSTVDIFDNEAQPLFLQTRQNSEGQLILPMLSFQGPHTFTGTKEELVPPERKPLLSYLFVSSDKESNFVSLQSLESSESDSGLESTLPTPTQDCDHTQYLPVETGWTQDCEHSPYLPAEPDWTPLSPQSPLSCDSDTQDSAYKQNWMPSFNHETFNLSYPWSRSGVKEKCKHED